MPFKIMSVAQLFQLIENITENKELGPQPSRGTPYMPNRPGNRQYNVHAIEDGMSGVTIEEYIEPNDADVSEEATEICAVQASYGNNNQAGNKQNKYQQWMNGDNDAAQKGQGSSQNASQNRQDGGNKNASQQSKPQYGQKNDQNNGQNRPQYNNNGGQNKQNNQRRNNNNNGNKKRGNGNNNNANKRDENPPQKPENTATTQTKFCTICNVDTHWTSQCHLHPKVFIPMWQSWVAQQKAAEARRNNPAVAEIEGFQLEDYSNDPQ
jgi:hypothetical protein